VIICGGGNNGRKRVVGPPAIIGIVIITGT